MLLTRLTLAATVLGVRGWYTDGDFSVPDTGVGAPACGTLGRAMIVDPAECRRAAAALRRPVEYNGFTLFSSADRPPGCWWYRHGRDQFFMNTNSDGRNNDGWAGWADTIPICCGPGRTCTAPPTNAPTASPTIPLYA